MAITHCGRKYTVQGSTKLVEIKLPAATDSLYITKEGNYFRYEEPTHRLSLLPSLAGVAEWLLALLPPVVEGKKDEN